MQVVDVVGWIAAGFTLVAFSMRTMMPLRIAALGSNVTFVAFGALSGALPILVLHLILLPFNAIRLWQLLRGLRAVRAARRGSAADFGWLREVATAARYADGAHVFRKGDAPDNLYFLDAGEVLLEEIGVRLGPGEIFGEIAFFTESKERTVSARCVGDCRILAIDEARFLALYHQNPAFGFAIVQLIANRLMDGIETRPDAYLPAGRAAAPKAPALPRDS